MLQRENTRLPRQIIILQLNEGYWRPRFYKAPLSRHEDTHWELAISQQKSNKVEKCDSSEVILRYKGQLIDWLISNLCINYSSWVKSYLHNWHVLIFLFTNAKRFKGETMLYLVDFTANKHYTKICLFQWLKVLQFCNIHVAKLYQGYLVTKLVYLL